MSSAYFWHFSFSLDSAVFPGPFKEVEIFEGATVQLVVQSQEFFFPSIHVKVVRPSGFLLSSHSPLGSSLLGMSMDAKASFINLFPTVWRGIRPDAFWQLNPCLPKLLTAAPQPLHLYGSQIPHILDPIQSQQTIWKLMLSSFKRKALIGIA